MNQRKSKSKLHVSPRAKFKKCELCEAIANEKILYRVELLQLNQKYFHYDVKAGMSCKFDNFVAGKLKVFPGGIHEFRKLYDFKRTLKKLYSWNEVLANITSVVRTRSAVDRYEPMHFSSNHYKMLLKYYHIRRNANSSKIKYKGSEDIGKSTEPGDIKLLKNSISQKKKKSPQPINMKLHKRNDSYVEIQKLTKSIQKMYNTFKNKKILSSLNEELKSKDQEKHNKINQENVISKFEKQIDQKISFIREKSKSKKKKKKHKTQDHYEDLYGLKKSHLSINKDRLGRRYTSKRVVTETITDKIQPLTPLSRGFYSPDEYYCTQKNSNVNSHKKPHKFAKKGKGSQSKSFKSKIKSKSKSKETYRLTSKLTKATSHTKLK